jgi:hypothetical protein
VSVSAKRDARALFEIEFTLLNSIYGRPRPNFKRNEFGQYVDTLVSMHWLCFYRGYRLGGGHE